MLSVNDALSYDRDAIGIGRKGTIDRPYILKAPFWTVDTLFYAIPREKVDLNYAFDIFQNIDWKKKDESTGVPSLSKTAINDIDVLAPKHDEQQIIGQFFAAIDNLITLHQRQPFLHSPPDISLIVQLTPPFYTFSWEQRKLGDISEIKTGPFGSTLHADDYVSDGTPIITTEHFKTGALPRSKNGLPQVSDYDYKRLTAYTLDDGDIVFSRVGSVDINALITPFQSNWLFSGRVLRVRPQTDISSKFLHTRLETESIKTDIRTRAVGQTMPSINTEILKITPLVLPSSAAEQEQIGSYFAALDNLITLHQRKFEKLTNVKKSMLEKMFPQNGSSYPEIRFKGFTDPWEQRKLGDMMNVTSVKRIHQSDWTDSGVRFLRARDIVAAAKNEEPDDYLYISKEKYEEYSALSGKVGVSDLLVTGVGTIGVPYLVRNLEPLYFKDGNIIWFQNSDKIDGKFLFYSFSAEQIQGFINESAGIGTVGTYTIESGKKTPISLPNQIEQAKVGEFFQQLDNLITLHQRELEKLQNIKKSMLEKMFV